MAKNGPQIDGFLAMIDAKIAALTTLADSYRAAVLLGALGAPGEEVHGGPASTSARRQDSAYDLPQGALLGKSLPAAIRLYMSAAKRKLTQREIGDALRAGGVESTAANFMNNVTTALHRLRQSGDVLKFDDGWALAELYPENLRVRMAAKAKPTPAKARKGKAKVDKPEPDRTAMMLRAVHDSGADGAELDGVIGALERNGIDVPRKYVRTILHRLVLRGQITKNMVSGRYFIVSGS